MKRHSSLMGLVITLGWVGLVVGVATAGFAPSTGRAHAYQFPTPTTVVQPSDTPKPPTNTPVVPTDTPVVPTNTPVPPSNTPAPGIPTNTPAPAVPTNTPAPGVPTNTPGAPPPASRTPRSRGGGRESSPPVSGTPSNAAVGWYVYVVSPQGLNLGAAPGFDAAHVQVVLKDSRVCVLEGPARADSLWWWKFRTAEGVEGWGVSDYVFQQTIEPCLGTPTATATPLAATRRPVARSVATATAVPVVPAEVAPTPTAIPTPPLNDLGVHVAHQGETLFCLGRAYGVSPWAIAMRNGMDSPNFLYAGQVLTIPDEPWDAIPPGLACPRQFEPAGAPQAAEAPTPSPTPAPACSMYRVVYGDTLWSIARRYGGSAWAIAVANHISNPDLIFVGRELCLP